MSDKISTGIDFTRLAAREREKRIIDRLRDVIAEAGGEWVGVQESMGDGQSAILLFNSPTTRSTLAVSLDRDPQADDWYPNLVASVRKRIKESDATFADRRISVKASILSDISNRLMRLVEEVDALYLKEKS